MAFTVSGVHASIMLMQDVTDWGSTKNHKLGTEFVDNATGKRFRYVTHDDGSASADTAANGVPCGPYAGAGSANGTTTCTTVTPDASEAQERVLGVYRGAPDDGDYGWIELKDASLPTTVKVDCSESPVQGTFMRWNADGELDSITVDSMADSGDVGDAMAMCLDSPNDTTYCTVAWL